jgi:hypothetical protein
MMDENPAGFLFLRPKGTKVILHFDVYIRLGCPAAYHPRWKRATRQGSKSYSAEM